MKTRRPYLGIAAAAMLLFSDPAAAASLRVSSNGSDSATCGGAATPCASLGQAIANAAAGDSILVGAGSYAGATVNKKLKLWSSNGNGGAVITSPVTLSSDDIVFGKAGKGFSLTPGALNTAVVVSGNGVTVRGNFFGACGTGINATGNEAVIRDNSFDGCGVAVRVAGSDALVRRNRTGYVGTVAVVLDPTSSTADVRENRMFGPSGAGIQIGGSGHLLRRNLMHGVPGGGFTVNGTPSGVELVENLVVNSMTPAYYLTSGNGWVLKKNAAVNNAAPGFLLVTASQATLVGNAAIGNAGAGIYVSGGGGHVLTDNSAIQNTLNGIELWNTTTSVTVTGGNLWGNTPCGLSNQSTSGVTADGVYWGAPGGPGPDPADCLSGNTGVIVVTDPAAKAARIKLPPVK